KGRGETDHMGRANITFSTKNKDLLKKGRLIVKLEGESSLVGDFPLKDAIWEADVQFFPEGGDLLAGLEKKVAFKAIGQAGKGLAVKGKVIDGKKNTVAEFTDLGLGMGYFTVLPQAGQTYKAVVTFPNGQEKTDDFPDVKAEGINLVLGQQTDDHVQLSILGNEAYFSKVQNTPFYIFGQLNGHLIYGAQATMKNASVTINVPKTNIPNGIMQFTLMSAQGQPLS